MKKISLVMSLFTMLSLVSCGPTSDPTTSEVPPTSDPTSEEASSEPASTKPSYPDGVIQEEFPQGHTLNVGDQMYDFSFTDIDGYYYDVNTEINTKELLVINFFASWCGPCKDEFPAMEAAYREYSDNVTIFALSVESKDTAASLRTAFQKRYDTTFPIGLGGTEYYLWFADLYEGYVPATVFVDRYGTVVKTHIGSMPEKTQWTTIFDKYTGSDYIPESVK